MNAGIEITWLTATTTSDDDLELSATTAMDEVYIDNYGFQVTLRRIGVGNYTSTLHVRDLGLNGTNLTCRGVNVENFMTINKSETLSICVAGNN